MVLRYFVRQVEDVALGVEYVWVRLLEAGKDGGSDLTLKEGEEVSWTCKTSVTVNTSPSSYWTVGTTRYSGNGSVTSNIQMNGVKVSVATIEIQTFPV